MLLSQIQEQARNLGLRPAARMRKADLIRTVQTAEGNSPCFGAEWRFSCEQQDCAWRQDCLKKNPG
jgi:hypothetical protein